jgi:hypothetical protein
MVSVQFIYIPVFKKNVEILSLSFLFLSVRVNPHGRAGAKVGGYRPAVAVISSKSEV